MGRKGITDASHENSHDRDLSQLPPGYISSPYRRRNLLGHLRPLWLVPAGRKFILMPWFYSLYFRFQYGCPTAVVGELISAIVRVPETCLITLCITVLLVKGKYMMATVKFHNYYVLWPHRVPRMAGGALPSRFLPLCLLHSYPASLPSPPKDSR
jgi:hypothetical protein